VRTLLRHAYGRLDALGAVSADDAVRFENLGARKERIRVTGDARFDQVCARSAALDAHAPHVEAVRTTDPIVVAGSTWPRDEAVLLAAVAQMRARIRVRLVIAPHEPTPQHLVDLENALSRHGLSHTRLGRLENEDAAMPDAVVVDRVGVLADLYSVATAAYVGGGFGRTGLHSVIEPAALGVPVLFGPRHGNAREADALAAEGGGFVVRDAAGLAARLAALLREPADAGARARAFVAARTGGAEQNAALLLSALRADPSRVDPARDVR
jgi:3-deoxy-D-manno-octulosonic-acid transferase